MTSQEIENAINFLVTQQAQFFSDMEEMKIRLEEMRKQQEMTQKHHDHAMRLITTLIERTLSNADAIEKNAKAIEKNAKAIEKNSESIDRLSEEVRALTAFIKVHVADKDAHKG
jgi:Mg2+ and Co2+ transporter CorA